MTIRKLALALFVLVGVASSAAAQSSIWTATTVPGPVANDPSAVEVGVKFTADTAGTVTGVRFYKYAANTGTHVGHLWSLGGTLLGSVTFAGETATGWQVASFATPIPVTASTTYVVSYHTTTGAYAFTYNGLTTAVNAAPLHTVANAVSANGVYAYGAGTFPNQTYQATNYWVDVVFQAGVSTTPTVSSLAPTSGVVGSTVVLAGTNLGASQGTSTVTFNGTAATVTSWSASSVSVVVPVGATTGSVVVTVGATSTAGRLFTVVPTAPQGVVITAASQIVWDEMGADVTTLGTYTYTAYVDTVKGPALPSTCAVVSVTQFTCTAPVPLASLVVGTHSIYVTATEGGVESGASNAVVVTVAPIATTTTVVMTGITTAATFTATVTSASGTPTGSVVFTDNGAPLLAMPLSTAGTATWTVMNVSLGPHVWVATYTGTGAFASSVAPALPTTVTIQ